MADEELVSVFAEVQRRGGIGRGAITDAIEHSDYFVRAAPVCSTVIDLGSGGGLPGLVFADRRRETRVLLVERRQKRADLLKFAVMALGLTETVEVFHGDVAALVVADHRRVDLVTARSFAAPLVVLQTAARLLRVGGSVIISETPDGRERWTAADLSSLGFRDMGTDTFVRCFEFIAAS